MHTLEAIQQRRSVKHYEPEHQMTQAEVEQLITLAKLSPTAFNQQNYRFVVVNDPVLREQIRAAAHDQTQVTDASLLIIICADLHAWAKEPVRYWANAPSDVQKYMTTAIEGYYRNHEQAQRDEAMRSAGIAAQTIMLAAKAMGYDSCPMDGFDFEEVGKLINLPEDHVIGLFVVVGKAAKPAQARPTQLAMEDVIVLDKF